MSFYITVFESPNLASPSHKLEFCTVDYWPDDDRINDQWIDDNDGEAIAAIESGWNVLKDNDGRLWWFWPPLLNGEIVNQVKSMDASIGFALRALDELKALYAVCNDAGPACQYAKFVAKQWVKNSY